MNPEHAEPSTKTRLTGHLTTDALSALLDIERDLDAAGWNQPIGMYQLLPAAAMIPDDEGVLFSRGPTLQCEDDDGDPVAIDHPLHYLQHCAPCPPGTLGLAASFEWWYPSENAAEKTDARYVVVTLANGTALLLSHIRDQKPTCKVLTGLRQIAEEELVIDLIVSMRQKLHGFNARGGPGIFVIPIG